MLYEPVSNESTALSISSSAILARNPSLPLLMPRIGIPESLTIVMVSRIVPSPPIENIKSLSLSRSLVEVNCSVPVRSIPVFSSIKL
jgi:hypothetical protein